MAEPTSPFASQVFPGVASVEGVFRWLKRHEKAGILFAVVFQALILGGTVASRALPYLTGETIRLRVQPVDPRDFFRGDYVILGYEFSRIPLGTIPGLGSDHGQWKGRTVYLTLVPEADGIHWRQDAFRLDRPDSGKFLRGTIVGYDRVEYGIESYYVQEGRGKQYEQAVRQRRLAAEVVVSPDGRAALRRLIVE
jgi:uncharacterized membrane-anchored protein